MSPGESTAAGHWLRQTVADRAHLTTDSRAVAPGDVFCAYRGEKSDGRNFIGDAIARGAAAIIWDPEGDYAWNPAWSVPQRAEPHLKPACGPIAAQWYRDPSERLAVIGVTGTSGKSSSALWLAQAAEALGRSAGLVGTLGAGRPGTLMPTGQTTPDPVLLQRLLAELAAQGVDLVALEVSSIGLAEGRLNGMHFDTAVFTNLTREHLDYHGTMEAYEKAKAQLFSWPRLRSAIVNLDDPAGARMASCARAGGARVSGFGLNASEGLTLFAGNLVHTDTGMHFDIDGDFGRRHFSTPLVGTFNVSNLLGVLATLLAMDVTIDDALRALHGLGPAPGRLERVGAGFGPMVLVDYAHKPDALEQALGACRALARARDGRLIVVFGCGGDRDTGKRPLMGGIASRLADRAIVTSDNPRTEDPARIAADVRAGALPGLCALELELDRRQAIRRAIADAAPADVVLIAGKGHETYQETDGRKTPFSDVEEATEALRLSHPGSAC